MENTPITYNCEKCKISVGALPGSTAICPKGHKMKPVTKEKEND